jgi:hypothetical protein
MFTMKFLRSILTFSLLSLTPAVAQESDALRDLQLGLNGILEASKNPELLAQLMQDLQVRFHLFFCPSKPK